MSGFRVKTDENLARSHVSLLQEGRLFVTLDLDFSDVREFPPGTHPGILLLRPRNKSRDAVANVLERIVAERALEDLKGCLVVADELHTRIRRPPDSE